MPIPKKPRIKCPVCGKEVARPSYKYCSNKCQQEFQYQSYIKEWQNGKIKGLNSLGLVASRIKKYLSKRAQKWRSLNINKPM